MSKSKPLRSLADYWDAYMLPKPMPVNHRKDYLEYMRQLRECKAIFPLHKFVNLTQTHKDWAKECGCDDDLLVRIAYHFGAVVV